MSVLDLFRRGGRTALVTGASAGIDRVIAGALASVGAGAVLMARRELARPAVHCKIERARDAAATLAKGRALWRQPAGGNFVGRRAALGDLLCAVVFPARRLSDHVIVWMVFSDGGCFAG